MQAGKLDRRVRIERGFQTRDEFGAEETAWNLIATVWASKVESIGLEAFRADQVAEAKGSALFRIRWRPDIHVEDRLVDEAGNNWDIEGIAEIGRKAGIELRCTRVIV